MSVEDPEILRERWLLVRERVGEAVRLAGRENGEVTLLAVSKLHPASSIAHLAGLGQVDFGESYVQEAMAKWAELDADSRCVGVQWHMIGHVQSKKAKDVAGKFSLIHSLDSQKLAEALQTRLPQDARQPVLIEINVGREPQKPGIMEEDLPVLAHAVLNMPGLDLQGLMCIPPIFDNGPEARPFFARLRELRDLLRRETGLPLPHLSMGMSGDFKEAIAEGATIVRIGTDIFGPRPIG